MSSVVDYSDRNTCVLFGDGAGAVLLEPNRMGVGLLGSILETDGAGEEYLCQRVGGSRRSVTQESLTAGGHYLQQDGRVVFKMAVDKMSRSVQQIMRQYDLSSEEVDFLVPHQANERIINMVAEKVGIRMERVMRNIDRFGNTTAATIPLCLWEYEESLKQGDTLVLVAFGAGFTWGSAYVRWAYGD